MDRAIVFIITMMLVLGHPGVIRSWDKLELSEDMDRAIVLDEPKSYLKLG